MSSSVSTLARGTDIIDLDRYMRNSVRPSDPRHARERLVVDAGGVNRVPVGDVGGVGGSDSERAGGERHKRYWHDSGLSDSSSGRHRRRQKPHRRSGEAHRRTRVSGRARPAASHSSVRELRAACESALRDQQQQLARMAELCRLLLQPQPAPAVAPAPAPAPAPDHNDVSNKPPTADTKTPCVRNVNEHVNDSAPAGQKNNSIEVQTKRNFGQNVSPSVRRRGAASDSSDVTTSSSGDERGRDRHRTESCKTYAIIMSKLDELGRLLAARRAPAAAPAPPAPAPAPPAPPAPAPAPPAQPAPPASKRDQLVATEDPATTIQVMHVRQRAERAPRPRRSGGDADSFGWWSESSELNEAHPYDVNNPLHLYAQAKRLQALHAAKRRATAATSPASNKLGNRSHDKLGDRSDVKLGGSLCALCRGYWRALRRCVTQQLFGACS